MERRENALEQIQQQASAGQAQEVQNLLNQGKFKQAESLARESKLNPKDWAMVNGQADNSIREISSEKLPEGPLSTDQAQKAVTGAEDQKILQYGEENMPGMKDIVELEEAVTESNVIIDEILELVGKAKKSTAKNMWAKPVGILALPVVADIYALIKGNKLRKQLKKLEKLNTKLENPNFLNADLKADQISPNMGHKLSLAGLGTMAGGVGIAMATANPIGAGIGAGIGLVGAVTTFTGKVKQIIDFVNMTGTSQSLRDLENKLIEARDKNQVSSQQINTVKQTYIQGARENLQPMMA